MNAALFGLCGALGGSLQTIADLYHLTAKWRAEQQTRLDSDQPPRRYRDAVAIGPQLTVGAFLIVMGSALATILGMSNQINSGFAAICIGVSAPAALGQLGVAPPIQSAVEGRPPQAVRETATPPAGELPAARNEGAA